MSLPNRPHPAHVPTLTEVIDLLPPPSLRPMGEAAADTAAPHNAQAAAAETAQQGDHPVAPPPIVTSGLPTALRAPSWTPMSTVMLSALDERPVRALTQAPLIERYDDDSLPHVATETPVVPVVPLVPLVPASSNDDTKPAVPEISEAQLTQRVLTDVQRQIDGMLEYRLRESISPILARHSEALVRDLREELTRTMRDVVTRSVAQEVAKLRQR